MLAFPHRSSFIGQKFRYARTKLAAPGHVTIQAIVSQWDFKFDMQISYPAIKHITTFKSTIPTVPKSVSFQRRLVPNENEAALSFQQGKNFFGPKLASPVFHPTVFFLSIYHPKDRFGHRPAAFRSQRIASGALTNEDRHRKGFS